MKNLKEKLSTKLSKNGGFTLVEMLIVVAIIAILIMISIPMVNSALEKARHATDDANFRDAAALGSILYLTESDTLFPSGTTTAQVRYYKVNDGKATAGQFQGTLVELANKADGYKNKCTSSSCAVSSATDGAKKGGYVIEVTIESTGEVTTKWVTAA